MFHFPHRSNKKELATIFSSYDGLDTVTHTEKGRRTVDKLCC